jgi:hypothetical protein
MKIFSFNGDSFLNKDIQCSKRFFTRHIVHGGDCLIFLLSGDTDRGKQPRAAMQNTFCWKIIKHVLSYG